MFVLFVSFGFFLNINFVKASYCVVTLGDVLSCQEKTYGQTCPGIEKTTQAECQQHLESLEAFGIATEGSSGSASSGSSPSTPSGSGSTDNCKQQHPTWSCQPLTACGISSVSACTAEKSCETNLCSGATYCCQGATSPEKKWCLTPEKNCIEGSGGACSGSLYDSQQTCINALNSSNTNSNSDSKSSESTTFNAQAIVSLENPIGTTDITQIFGNLIKVSLGILGSLALLVFIYGGFVWLTSAGSSDKVQKGTTAMVWAVMGIVVIFASYAIINVILQGLGVSTASAVVTTNKKLDTIPETKKSQVCHCNVVASASIPVLGSCNTTISQDFIIGKSYGPIEYKQLIDQASMTGSGCTTAKTMLNGQIKDMQPIVFTENTCKMFSDTTDSKFGATYNLKCQLQ